MSEPDGPKRLEPRMTPGSFRFLVWADAGLAVVSTILALNARFWRGANWDFSAFLPAAALFLISGILLGYLIHVRRNDRPFWNEEEAKRDDWDRRGRQL
ncbi:hypothetical protein [Paenarthrobacter sp. PH39-S1]|uniref:hypothetical protein n=1 Tax=Paenarthrobacter sp. PH39-S1 TaxID=3046204 RepID=UPI0024B8A1E7|nr:hypothetical protein [Paenarthrobacter sp. PH39-S1]MDJ0355451.1 hypothetical protein [Paenarthrobacter sp. PH39-S1]